MVYLSDAQPPDVLLLHPEERFLAHPLSLLTPAFSLPSAPQLLTVLLRRQWNAPLPL